MNCVSQTKSFHLLSENDPPAARVVNANGRASVCLVCEHASAAIPSRLGDLGLAVGDRYSHAVWDIGAEKLATRLSEALDAPLVLGGVSRLVYDCNRPPERADAMPAQTEEIQVLRNREIPADERAARVEEIYVPFNAAVSKAMNGFREPAVFATVHSFTPHWHGKSRATEIGLLHDKDPALAQAMLDVSDARYRVELNAPYSAADGVTHMLARHGTSRAVPNVTIEVRNDLLEKDEQIEDIAGFLEMMLTRALVNMGGTP